jgi:hypothetical protein
MSSACVVSVLIQALFRSEENNQKLFREKSQQSLSCIHFDKNPKRTNPAFFGGLVAIFRER